MKWLRQLGDATVAPHRTWAAMLVAAVLAIHVASVPAWAQSAEIRLSNGSTFKADRIVFNGSVLIADLPYGRLQFPRKDLHYVSLSQGPVDIPEADRRLLLADGTQLVATMQELQPDRLVVVTPYGTLTVTDLSVVSAVGFGSIARFEEQMGAPFELVLQDGNLLVGEPVSFDGSTLGFRTRYGELRVAASYLNVLRRRGVQGMPAQGVLFSNGDRLKATLKSIAPSRWTFSLPFGELVVDRPAGIMAIGFRGEGVTP